MLHAKIHQKWPKMAEKRIPIYEHSHPIRSIFELNIDIFKWNKQYLIGINEYSLWFIAWFMLNYLIYGKQLYDVQNWPYLRLR